MLPLFMQHLQGIQATPPGPCDWPLLCLKAHSRHFMDISLPFGLQLEASCCCQDVMSFVVTALQEEGGSALNYIDDFWGSGH